MVLVIGYAKAGKNILLVEADNFGGDCTNFGCIPSNFLIAGSKIAHHFLALTSPALNSIVIKQQTDGIVI